MPVKQLHVCVVKMRRISNTIATSCHRRNNDAHCSHWARAHLQLSADAMDEPF